MDRSVHFLRSNRKQAAIIRSVCSFHMQECRFLVTESTIRQGREVYPWDYAPAALSLSIRKQGSR